MSALAADEAPQAASLDGADSYSPTPLPEDAPRRAREALAAFLRASSAYDLLSPSGKVIVFDVDVPIRLALYALVEHDAAAAPLWDSARGRFSGMLTTTDLCDIMRIFHVPGTQATAAALAEFTISTWRSYAAGRAALGRALPSNPSFGRLSTTLPAAGGAGAGSSDEAMAVDSDAVGGSTRPGRRRDVGDANASTGGSGGSFVDGSARRPASGVHRDLIAIDPEEDLLTVVRKLRHHAIHHLPVLDVEQGAVLAVLSYRSLLLHLVAKFTDASLLPLLAQPLLSLGIGSFGEDILVVPESASVVSVLHVLAERHVSSVPIVAADGSGVLVDIYCREDVAFLANDPSLMVLDAPVGDVRRAQISMTGIGSSLLTCAATDTLENAITLFAVAAGRTERIICVDAERRVTGVVSLSDIFAYIVQDAT